jgi:SAM-dependent methyltransferase
MQNDSASQEFSRIINVANESYRNEWVLRTLRYYAEQLPAPVSLLDVGAGLSPYKESAKQLGYEYRSHDFSAYVPSSRGSGLQSATWEYPEHDFIMDILDLPTSIETDLILCTEVLEHVPDPVRAFQKMVSLLKPGGIILITVPFLSLMHQAPYWFQAGLSPFWFSHHSAENDIEAVEITVYGDYSDLMSQEIGRMLTFKRRIPGLSRLGGTSKVLRNFLPQSVLESGGFGTAYVGKKILG